MKMGQWYRDSEGEGKRETDDDTKKTQRGGTMVDITHTEDELRGPMYSTLAALYKLFTEQAGNKGGREQDCG